jgi:chitin disaccharide deacetylase
VTTTRTVTTSRRLIVNADDFGQSAGVNEGVLRGHDEGVITSASLMVRWPSARDAAEAAQARPGLSVGLHVDLGEWRLSGGQWQPVYEVVVLRDAGAVQREVCRQLDSFRSWMGHEPSHLDSHQHVHRREPVRAVLTGLARELGVPLRHFARRVRYCGDFYGQDEHGVQRPGVLSADYLVGLLETLPAGTTELACHPAAAADLSTMYCRERRVELEVLCNQRVRQAASEIGIEFCSFHDVCTAQLDAVLMGEAR